jgi:membrane protease YdiL (CAAX protease family)
VTENLSSSVLSDSSAYPRRSLRGSDWRLAREASFGWTGRRAAVELALVGLGIIGSSLLNGVTQPWAEVASTLSLWSVLVAGLFFAFRRASPNGLLRFRPYDLLLGAVVGLLLRLVQGLTSGANAGPFPTLFEPDGTLTPLWWFTYSLPTGLIGPTVEELFFRGLILVSVYQLGRLRWGPLAAGVSASLASAGSFVLFHAVFAPPSLQGAVQLLVVGVTCAALVLLTGRIWGALFCHVMYNVTFLAIAMIGTILR